MSDQYEVRIGDLTLSLGEGGAVSLVIEDGSQHGSETAVPLSKLRIALDELEAREPDAEG